MRVPPPTFRGPHSAETRERMSRSQRVAARRRKPAVVPPEVRARIVRGVIAYSRVKVTCAYCGRLVGQRALGQHHRGSQCTCPEGQAA